MNPMFVSYRPQQQPTQTIRSGANGFMSMLSDITGGDGTPPQQVNQTNYADTPEAKAFFMNSLGFDYSSMVYEGDIQEDYNHMIGIIKPPTPQFATPSPYSMNMTPPPYGGAQPTPYGGYPPVNPYPYLTQGQIMDATASTAAMLQNPAIVNTLGEISVDDYNLPF